jgi:dTMP kinase
MKNGILITFEGPDGCGKSTQAQRLTQFLKRHKFSVVQTREPGGTPFAEVLRECLLNPRYCVPPLAELLLFEAIRAHHLQQKILPALKKGQVVVCDRYTDSTCAYQGYGRGLDLSMIHTLNQIATQGIVPQLTLVLDISGNEGFKRIKNQRAHKAKDRMEQEAVAFHNRVRNGYLALAKQDPKRIKVISGVGTISEVHQRVVSLVKTLLKK